MLFNGILTDDNLSHNYKSIVLKQIINTDQNTDSYLLEQGEYNFGDFSFGTLQKNEKKKEKKR